MANAVHNTLTDADLHASERQYAGNPNGALSGIQGQYCEDTNTGDVYRCNGGTSWERIIDFSEVGKVPLTSSDIGVSVQAYSANLNAIAALAVTDGNFIVGDGATWVAENPSTARGSLGATTVGSNLFTLTNPSAVTFLRVNADNTVTARSAADFKADLDLEIGVDVQAYDADLTAIAGLTPTDSNIIVGNGTTWVAESGATARTSLGLGTSDSPSFAGLTVDTDTLYVDSANNRVGIGTTSPLQKLQIEDSAPRITLRGTGNGNNVGYRFTAKDSGGTDRQGGYYFQGASGTNQSYLGLSADDSNYQMIVRADGNVGIGQTSPAYKLDVSGRVGFNGSLGSPTSGFFPATGNGTGLDAVRITPDEVDFTHSSGFQYFAGINSYAKTKTSSNGNIAVFGIYNVIRGQATTNASSVVQIQGAFNSVTRDESTDISTNGTLFGVSSSVVHSSTLNSSAISDNAYGLNSAVNNQAGTIGNTYGTRSLFRVATQASTTATSTTIYGFHSSATVGRSAGDSTGTVTDYYDIYLAGATVYSPSTVSNKWGIYQASSSHTNFLAGDVGIGVTNPSAKLEVGGGVTTDGDVKNKDFSAGFSGSKWQITEAGSAEFDSLTVRGSLKAYELIVKQISTIGGTEILSVAQGKVEAVNTGTDVITVQSVSGTPAQPFKAGDVIIIQASNMETTGESGLGFTVRRIVFTVDSVSSNTFLIDTFDTGSISDIQVGDVMVAIGNVVDADRQAIMYRNVDRNKTGSGDRLIMRMQTGITSLSDYTSTSKTRIAFGDIGDYTGGAYAETFGFFAGTLSANHALITPSGFFLKDGSDTLAELSSGSFRVGASGGNRIEYDGSSFTLQASTFNLSAGQLAIGNTPTMPTPSIIATGSSVDQTYSRSIFGPQTFTYSTGTVNTSSDEQVASIEYDITAITVTAVANINITVKLRGSETGSSYVDLDTRTYTKSNLDTTSETDQFLYSGTTQYKYFKVDLSVTIDIFSGSASVTIDWTRPMRIETLPITVEESGIFTTVAGNKINLFSAVKNL